MRKLSLPWSLEEQNTVQCRFSHGFWYEYFSTPLRRPKPTRYERNQKMRKRIPSPSMTGWLSFSIAVISLFERSTNTKRRLYYTHFLNTLQKCLKSVHSKLYIKKKSKKYQEQDPKRTERTNVSLWIVTEVVWLGNLYCRSSDWKVTTHDLFRIAYVFFVFCLSFKNKDSINLFECY